jgi:hypothetical protein
MIAVAALLISLANVWSTHFAPANLRVITGAANLKIERIDSGKGYWYLPKMTIPVSVSNAGARIAHVLELRLIVRYPQNDAAGAYEVFHLLYEIDPTRTASLKAEEAQRVRNLYNGPGTPFMVSAKETVTKHLVFQTRWDYEIEEPSFVAELQLRAAGSKNWVVVQYFNGRSIDAWLWQSIDNSTFVIEPRDWKNHFFERHPDSLHRR